MLIKVEDCNGIHKKLFFPSYKERVFKRRLLFLTNNKSKIFVFDSPRERHLLSKQTKQTGKQTEPRDRKCETVTCAQKSNKRNIYKTLPKP